MVTLDFEVYNATTGDYMEDVSIDGYFDHAKNCYVPDPDDWHELIATFIGKNVVISQKNENIVIEGLDKDGNLALLANDGAEDHQITLIDDFISGDQNDEILTEDNNEYEES